MKTITLLFIALTLAACSTPAVEHGSVIETTIKSDGSRVVVENRSDYANYANTKLELAKKNLFEMECPPQGCTFLKLAVANPNAGSDIKEPAAPPKVESAAVGVAREIKETIGLAMPVAMAATVGHTVGKLFTAFGGSVESIAGKIQAPQANVTTTNTSNVATTNTNSGNTTSNTNSGNTTTSTSTSQTVSNTGQTGTAKIGP